MIFIGVAGRGRGAEGSDGRSQARNVTELSGGETRRRFAVAPRQVRTGEWNIWSRHRGSRRRRRREKLDAEVSEKARSGDFELRCLVIGGLPSRTPANKDDEARWRGW